MRAVLVESPGGPDVLQFRTDVPEPQVTAGTTLLDVTAAGVNYADTHASEDSYLAKQTFPLVPGSEVVGRTSDGRRVVALLSNGGYAERAAAPVALTFDVPDGVEDGQALALVLQGVTAWHLLRTSTHLAAGESVVVHAAAGGVGTIAVQLAKLWGAGRVIAVASSADKRDLALRLGADVAVDAGADDLQHALQEANDGRKVDVVLEMVGGATFDASLAALAPFGRLATFGMASRQQPKPITAGELMARSRTVAGFWLAHCMADPRRMIAAPLAELFALVQSGELRPVVGGTYPLAEARRAHEDMRARRTTGKLVLDPAR